MGETASKDMLMFNSGNWEPSSEESAAFGNTSFLKLKEGDTNVRILGKYVFRNTHYIENAEYRHTICCGTNCPACEQGHTPKMYYYVNVLDRTDDKVKILRFPKSVKDKLKNVISKFGDISQLDICITRTGSNLDTTYEVLPNPVSKPISPAVLEYMKVSFNDLESVFKIPTREELLTQITPSAKEMSGKVSDRKINSKPDINVNKPVATNTAVNIDTGSNKPCYGKTFNPINPTCATCAEGAGCKDIVIKQYSA